MSDLKKLQKDYEQAIRNDEAIKATSRMYAVLGGKPQDWLETATGREISDAMFFAVLERK